MKYKNAYSLLASFGDRVMNQGTQSFSNSELHQYGLSEASNGTWTGTTYFPDGTSAGLILGEQLDGTTCPTAACMKVYVGQEEVGRLDWNSQAAKPRDRYVHAHINASRHHKYSKEWKKVKAILKIILQNPDGEEIKE